MSPGDALGAFHQQFGTSPAGSDVAAYDSALSRLEQALWAHGFSAQLLPLYQRLFAARELLLTSEEAARQHQFVIAIPVADRPRQLRRCLDSLLAQCRLYGYGGLRGGVYAKVRVVLAEDSREAGHRQANQAMVAEYRQQGLRLRYFGLEQQAQLLALLPPALRQQLQSVLGDLADKGLAHKGAAITRNLCCLDLYRRHRDDARRLIWFVDSDQTFQVRIADADVHALNYFHVLDRLFHSTPTQILTGKVVGDPPVSPAVMAANLLADIRAFLEVLAVQEPRAECRFHGQAEGGSDDAAYHDMADLFGFRLRQEAVAFACKLTGAHDHCACLEGAAARLPGFFAGDHPTRSTAFHPAPATPAPARTLYTGNYLLRPAALSWFIPFAPLRLRMAGPVLGRLLQRPLGAAFAAANLPLLHSRTLDDSARAEYRPGVEYREQEVDLQDEFERQFFGDVLLFAMERLVAHGFPERLPSVREIDQVLQSVCAELTAKYRQKQALVLERLAGSGRCLDERAHWWWRYPELQSSLAEIRQFMQNLERNFVTSARGQQLINDPGHRTARLQALSARILAYPQDCRHWQQALDVLST